MASCSADCVTRHRSSILPETPASCAPRQGHLDVALLKRCTRLREFQQFHGQILKNPTDQPHQGAAQLIEALAASSHMGYAGRVFDELRDPSTFVFNNMIRGYGLCGEGQEGVLLYARMRRHGVGPDSFTYPFLLKACTSHAQGRGIHSLILKLAGPVLDVYSQTSLVSFYADNGDLESARMLFDRMPEWNVVPWTAMITGYVRQKRYADGLSLFRRMLVTGVEPNEMTLASSVPAPILGLWSWAGGSRGTSIKT